MASTNKTTNYGLNQWVSTDPVLMADMNADNAKIDAAIKSLADSAVKFAVGSYVGTGTYGSGQPSSLTFDFAPKVVVIRGQSVYYSNMTVEAVLICPAAKVISRLADGSDSQLIVSWDGNTVSWWTTDSSTHGRMLQLNYLNETYNYFAIG